MGYRLNRRKSPITKDTAKAQGWHRLGGGVDAEAFKTHDNTVILFTGNPLKVKYFYHLGILMNDWGWYVGSRKGYDGKIWYDHRRTYVVELPLLVQLNDTGTFDTAEDRLYWNSAFYKDWRNNAGYEYGERRKFIVQVEPEHYGEFWSSALTAVKQLIRHVRYIGLDFHAGNVLQCPITGVILPTDVFNIHGN